MGMIMAFLGKWERMVKKKGWEILRIGGGLVRTLLGSDSDALAMLNKEVAGMNTRAAALELASKQVSDPDIKRILDAQISILKQEAGKLQSFITSQSEIKSILGWLSAFIPKFWGEKRSNKDPRHVGVFCVRIEPSGIFPF